MYHGISAMCWFRFEKNIIYDQVFGGGRLSPPAETLPMPMNQLSSWITYYRHTVCSLSQKLRRVTVGVMYFSTGKRIRLSQMRPDSFCLRCYINACLLTCYDYRYSARILCSASRNLTWQPCTKPTKAQSQPKPKYWHLDTRKRTDTTLWSLQKKPRSDHARTAVSRKQPETLCQSGCSTRVIGIYIT